MMVLLAMMYLLEKVSPKAVCKAMYNFVMKCSS
jgi:hypothetical protein